MKNIEIFENGIFLQFQVDDEENLHLLTVSPACETVTREKYDVFTAVEVQTTGAHEGSPKHIQHTCPAVPKYVSHSISRGGNGLLAVFTLRSESVEIKQSYQFYDGISVISCQAEVTNISDEAVGLEYVSSFAMAGFGSGELPIADNCDLYVPHNSWCEELNWRKHSLGELGFNRRTTLHATTKRLNYSNTGTWSAKEYLPMGGIHDREKDQAVFWQIEHNGSWNWEIGDLFGSLYLRLSGPSEAENGWWKELAPGESFTSVPAAVAAVNGGFEKAMQELTKYRRRIVPERHIDRNLPVIFNDYMDCLWANPTTESELPMIEKAAELGAEIYVMDAGWYYIGDWWPMVGEWKICEERFTGGLKPIFDRIHALGMRAGIWVEPEVMGVDCPLVPEFSDCFFMRHGKPVISKGRYQLDFRKKKVTDHLNKVVDHLIGYLGVSYFKFDYNIDPGVGTETDADSFGDGLMQCNAAYLRWLDSLYERHPGLMIENCSSGGLRMEYGSLKHYTMQSVSDVMFYDEFAHMSAMASSAVLPEQTGIWVTPSVKNTPAENAFCAVNGMLHRMYMSGRIDLLDEQNFAVMQKAVQLYKNIRQDIVGSIPLFPGNICNSESDWMLSGCISGDDRKLYIAARHMRGEGDEKIISLDGFCPDSAEIVYPDFTGEAKISGSDLMVTVPEKAAVLVRIQLK